jgi:magnesium transporter
MFEETIQQVVALAVLMPIVASMGGIAGSQTLTLMIRGMAVGQVSNDNVKWLLNREFLATTLNGFLFALVVSAAAMVWFRDPTIGLVIAMALVINLTIASIVGTLLPLTLKRLNIDPALAGGVILLTTTDVVGFLSFLGLATYFYA